MSKQIFEVKQQTCQLYLPQSKYACACTNSGRKLFTIVLHIKIFVYFNKYFRTTIRYIQHTRRYFRPLELCTSESHNINK